MEHTIQKTTGDILAAIQRALENLKYGSVEITVHDGTIVQIERKEKVRFNPNQKGARNV